MWNYVGILKFVIWLQTSGLSASAYFLYKSKKGFVSCLITLTLHLACLDHATFLIPISWQPYKMFVKSMHSVSGPLYHLLVQEKSAEHVGSRKNLYKVKCELKYGIKLYCMEYYFETSRNGKLTSLLKCLFFFSFFWYYKEECNFTNFGFWLIQTKLCIGMMICMICSYPLEWLSFWYIFCFQYRMWFIACLILWALCIWQFTNEKLFLILELWELALHSIFTFIIKLLNNRTIAVFWGFHKKESSNWELKEIILFFYIFHFLAILGND